MMRSKDQATSAILVAVSVVLGGCGAAPDGYSGSRGKVTGRATVGDEPLAAGCQVLFIATKGGYTAAGSVGSDGGFALQYQVAQGLPVGDYAVQISPPPTAAGSSSADPAEMAQQMKIGPGGIRSSLPFPDRYASTATSGLSFSVQAGENKFDLKLTPEKGSPGGKP